jgi:hypothetical protein
MLAGLRTFAVMDSPSDSTHSRVSSPTSKSLPGPPFLRHYAGYQLVAWQPQGVLDDLLLEQIAEWLLVIEKVADPFKRFVDFSRLTSVAVRTRHVFEFAEKRAEQFTGVGAVRTALFSDEWVSFGIARLYESLMENTPIESRAFRDRAKAAEWLGVPANVLTLKDEPAPHVRTAARRHS